MSTESKEEQTPPKVRIVLSMIVRNEERTLPRCFAAVRPLVDAAVIVDTGSTDGTPALVEQWAAADDAVSLVRMPWKNFGACRTAALRAAEDFVTSTLGWDLSTGTVFAVTVDADMVWRGTRAALEQCLCAHTSVVNFTVQQRAGKLHYYNTRVMRLSVPWTCAGVTHEAWGAPRSLVDVLLTDPDTVAWIDDRNDGGCKADKFVRDLALLDEGLREEPGNTRYVFYRAQTLKDMGRFPDAIKGYKQRIAAGGWREEVWYSYYKAAECWVRWAESGSSATAKDATDSKRPALAVALAKASTWVLRAHAFYPLRNEAALFLATKLREQGGSPHLAWHFVELAARVHTTADLLFVESDCYRASLSSTVEAERVAYERCILAYYVFPSLRALKAPELHPGMTAAVAYSGPRTTSVYKNIHWYAQPAPVEAFVRLAISVPLGFVSSSVSALPDGTVNVRAVSYHILPNGAYQYPSGTCATRNFHVPYDTVRRCLDANAVKEVLTDITLPARTGELIKGLEDVRIGPDGTSWTATTREYSNIPGANRMVCGSAYPSAVGAVCATPPTSTVCEKNWIPLGGGRLLYSWGPLVVGSLDAQGQFIPDARVPGSTKALPWLLSYARGSAPPVRNPVTGQQWFLVHYVFDVTAPRTYLHGWVVVDDLDSMTPVAYTAPFTLKHKGIEYSSGVLSTADGELHIFMSVWDRESWVAVSSFNAFAPALISI